MAQEEGADRRPGDPHGSMSGAPIRRRSLTQGVIDVLRQRILGGALRPGDKLPTEPNLIREFGVSRTVIREAIAGLRADGLVDPRHGVGVFVCEPPSPTRLALPSVDSGLLSSIIEALELRTAVEIEAAGMAATRGSPAQIARIGECFAEMGAALRRGDSTSESDFAFHLAIAEATNNPLFREFLEFLGRRTIPRSRIVDAGGIGADYLVQIEGEHRTILEAITAHDSTAARLAMRTHLKGSLDRYQGLLSRGQ